MLYSEIILFVPRSTQNTWIRCVSVWNLVVHSLGSKSSEVTMLQTVSKRSCCLLLQVAMAGDFILAVASMMIARLRDDDVTITLSQVTRVCVHVCLLCLFAGRSSRQTCLHVLLNEPCSQKYRFWVDQNITSIWKVTPLPNVYGHVLIVSVPHIYLGWCSKCVRPTKVSYSSWSRVRIPCDQYRSVDKGGCLAGGLFRGLTPIYSYSVTPPIHLRNPVLN